MLFFFKQCIQKQTNPVIYFQVMRKRIIDMHKLNPNWGFAADHGKASRPGLQTQKEGRHVSNLMCPCCLNIVQKQQVSLWQNSKQLFFLGYGFPLFYNLIQFCIMLLFMLIMTQSLLLLYTGITQDCHAKQNLPHSRLLATATTTVNVFANNSCQNIFVRLSKTSHVITGSDIINRIVSFVAAVVLLLNFRDSQRKLALYHKQRNIKQSDYAIIFKNLPQVKGIKTKIQKFLKEIIKSDRIEQIILIPSFNHFYLEQNKKNQVINLMKKVINDPIQNKQKINQYNDQLKTINEAITTICVQLEKLQQQDQLESQKAIVILQTQKQKIKVLDIFNKLDKNLLKDYFGQQGADVTIKQAPQPRQIIWQNINYPKKQRWIKILIGWILSALTIGVVFVAFFFAIQQKSLLIQHSLDNISAYNEAVIIVYLSIFGVQLFNKYVLKIFLHMFSQMQKPQTSSQLEFSYGFKYTLGMFFTTALMTLAVEAIRFQNYTNPYGVVEEQSIIFFFNAYFINLLWIIHPQYYIKKFRRYLNAGRIDMTQSQANQLMEDTPYDNGKRYAQILQTMWFTFLYSSLIPAGAFLTCSGLCIYYWVDKYNLLRRSKIQNNIETKLPTNAVTLLEMLLLWKPLGQLLFDYQLRGQLILPSTIVMVCIGFIYMITPWTMVLNFFYHEKFKLKTQKFQEIKYQLNETYRTVNPRQRYVNLDKFIQRKNKISKIPTFIRQMSNIVVEAETDSNIKIDNNNDTQLLNVPKESSKGPSRQSNPEYSIDYNSHLQIVLDIPDDHFKSQMSQKQF